MKKFIFGLILTLFAFSALPVQASAPDDGVKTEIVKATAFDFVNVLEVSIEAPQVRFENPSIYKPVGLWNYSNKKMPADLNISNFQKAQVQSWRFIDKNKANLNASTLKCKNLHIDPGSFSHCNLF